ncbi:glycosyltransferase family 4 protein [Pseudokineococcus lusitanus]|uniref:Glycosyltransferase involved in cell wall biosynthesis n=1 Tax=Pseudokineococcus lusitanus TaxID=763993 RepID=A0A3N1G943_9ACTN|nr:glycosyltransferase family 4 protein [Pseudokineococcus lusitanus]ROP26746.1 glycosyltransferase involved in cell wall biosynthesis [Pseudokineococcus lusitanus]
MPAVAYLVSQHPALSHAFITQEIRALEDRGWTVQRYSVRPPDPEHLTLAPVAAEARRTTVLRGAVGAGALALLRAAVRSPHATASMSRNALRVVRPHGGRAVGVRALALAVATRASYLLQAAVLAERLDASAVRHVHVHFANNAAEVARLACGWLTAAGRPTSYSLTLHSMAMHGLRHRPDDDWPDGGALRWGPLADKVRGAAFTACISEFCRQRAREVLDGLSADLPIVHMGVDVGRFSPSPAETTGGEPADPAVLLFVGRWAEEKGTGALLDAVDQLLDEGLDLRLLVAGDGPLRDTLKARVSGSSRLSPAVELLGPVANDALPDLYRGADLLCLPSTVEGVPVVLMEAMASGLPVVSTRIDGIPELVEDQVSGLLCTPGDHSGLVSAIRDLLQAPERRARMGAAARARVLDAFDSSREVVRLEERLRAAADA